MVKKKKTALILSGGGAKGAFQCGAEKYAREVKHYQWDIIAGVSVGALNAAMLGMHKYQRLWEVWNTVTSEQVMTGGFNAWSVLKLLFGAKSFYGNKPLEKMLREELASGTVSEDVRIGAVSLVTGEYVQFRRGDPHLAEAILASTVMPIIWTPVDVSPQHLSMVDGGVRNISPVGDVLDSDPDEVVIINCGSAETAPLPEPPKNIVKIGERTLDILLNELFRGDMQEFLRINALVHEAGAHGVTLHHPVSGKPYKYFECKVIEPTEPLGDTLDFNQEAIQASLRHGAERAKEVLGV